MFGAGYAGLPEADFGNAYPRYDYMNPQKGFDFLLQAMHELVHKRGRGRARLRILGTGPLHDKLAKYINDRALKACVSLVGYRQNPLPFLKQADLFCLSSLYEGMPNALVEAMLCRVPVLATDCPSGPAKTSRL